jgi:uncharacterized membrane protein YcgQ (UPF0703/DUF1980 family)
VITCCAADAYPVGLPVKINGNKAAEYSDRFLPPQNRQVYSPDTWLEVEGEMSTENIGSKRQLTIQARSLKQIPEPQNPYEY